jgi:predicted acetyltransferase
VRSGLVLWHGLSVTCEDATLRSAADDDWPAMMLLAATCFGWRRPVEVNDMWRTMTPADGALIACDGTDVVGMALYLDLKLTVPGGAVLPVAGITWVAVAPTHRRRGILRQMFVELHQRTADGHYPIVALLASEGGIYGRFGYGPATTEQTLCVQRRTAQFHPDVPDPGQVRIVEPAQHRDQIEAIYETWRLRTPGGLHTSDAMWDEVFADRDIGRRGGSPLFGLLRTDGFVLYRTHVGPTRTVQVVKLTALTAEAHIALWRTMLGLDLMESVTITTYPADPLPYLLTDPRLVQTLGSKDGLWLRIRDVPAALEARTYGADCSAVLDITDAGLGVGRFTLEIRDGRARCTPGGDPVDVELDLGVLGSLYLGVHRASAFAAANRLRCNNSGLIGQLDSAFATDTPADLGFTF